MKVINHHFNQLKALYDTGDCPLDAVCDLSVRCLAKLEAVAAWHQLSGGVYCTLTVGNEHSRPLRRDMFQLNGTEFQCDWTQMIQEIDAPNRRINMDTAITNRTLYTALMSFSACFDIWKRSSRKTPGTFFEVIIGSLLSRLLPAYTRSKHVIIPNEIENVSTDIVFTKAGAPGLVLPVKITTRERIVQPFAHQRILESVFGADIYRSVLICCSELQLAGTTAVREVCVPGTLRLFQRHLAKMTGIYYLDIPRRYQESDVTAHIPVRSLGTFLGTDLAAMTMNN